MTDPTPEELDALVARMLDGCNLQQRDGEHAAAAITALRAREAMIEAAAIERAAKILGDTGYKSVDDTLNQSLCCSGHMCGCRGASIGDWLAHIIRDLAKPGARTLLDQRIAAAEQAGYERGLREAGRDAR